MLELRVEKVSFFTPFCLQILPVAFEHLYEIKNKCQPSEGKAANMFFSFPFFASEGVGDYK